MQRHLSLLQMLHQHGVQTKVSAAVWTAALWSCILPKWCQVFNLGCYDLPGQIECKVAVFTGVSTDPVSL